MPHFIALSASSPVLPGRGHVVRVFAADSVSRVPAVGPHAVRRATGPSSTRYFDAMHGLGIVESMKDFYWDIRPKPEYGTVEIRVCDTPLTVDARPSSRRYAQALARLAVGRAAGRCRPDVYRVYSYNRFQACRHGLAGTLVDAVTRHQRRRSSTTCARRCAASPRSRRRSAARMRSTRCRRASAAKATTRRGCARASTRRRRFRTSCGSRRRASWADAARPPRMITTLFYSLFALDQTLAQLAAQYGPWLYVLLFLIIFAETGLVVLPFLPGDSILFIAGTVVAVAGPRHPRARRGARRRGGAGRLGQLRGRALHRPARVPSTRLALAQAGAPAPHAGVLRQATAASRSSSAASCRSSARSRRSWPAWPACRTGASCRSTSSAASRGSARSCTPAICSATSRGCKRQPRVDRRRRSSSCR